MTTRQVLIRNGILIGIGLVASLVPRPAILQSRGNDAPRVPSAGFTLVELLVVISVVAILIGLTFPAIGLAKRNARSSVSSSNIRGAVQGISSYTHDFKDLFPYITRPGSHNTTLTGGGLTAPGLSYFEAFRTWHIPLSNGYVGNDAKSKALFPPGWLDIESSPWPYQTAYAYPCAFIAAPEYWNPLTRIDSSQFRATTIGDVQWADRKALIVQIWSEEIERHPGQASARYSLGCVDGSVRSFAADGLMSGYEHGDGPNAVLDGAIHHVDAPVALHTIDGVRGRDVR